MPWPLGLCCPFTMATVCQVCPSRGSPSMPSPTLLPLPFPHLECPHSCGELPHCLPPPSFSSCFRNAWNRMQGLGVSDRVPAPRSSEAAAPQHGRCWCISPRTHQTWVAGGWGEATHPDLGATKGQSCSTSEN